MLDVADPIDKALIAHPRFADMRASDADYDLQEAVGLAIALGVEPAEKRIIALREVKVSNFFGSGQIADMHALIKAQDIKLVIINAALSPVQQRNLEKIWGVKVIDRTGLILEIFGLRAATKEGKLQVELARLSYERSRLVRTWTHLERQRGGIGAVAGPGETQIESDRRILNDKMAQLKRQLEEVRRTRGLQRQKRQRAPERVVALIGYTNAGKSTLFNHLTRGGVLAKNMLFATLDTTHRILPLPSGNKAILSDTVGFISDLPTALITAFRATLEEVKEADLILHLRDISDPLTERRCAEVMLVLDQIKAGPEHGQDMLEIWNKSDLLTDEARRSAAQRAQASLEMPDMMKACLINCYEPAGLEALLEQIEIQLSAHDQILDVDIPPESFTARAWLYENGQILNESSDARGIYKIKVRLSEPDAGRFRARHAEFIT